VVRGTPLDLFGYTHERRTERGLIREFEGRIDEILQKLSPENHTLAVGLANIPQKIRGFGHVKERNLKAAKQEEAELLARFRAGEPPMQVAAE
jgi:indolepyruvate ferredoxin oxidoreductase